MDLVQFGRKAVKGSAAQAAHPVHHDPAIRLAAASIGAMVPIAFGLAVTLPSILTVLASRLMARLMVRSGGTP